MVPACLVYPLRQDNAKHHQALQEFHRQEKQDVMNANMPVAGQNLVFKRGSPSTSVLNLLAREVCSTWKVLCRQLRIPDSDLHQIEADNQGHYEQCYHMLKRWTEVQVNPPTYDDLGQALQHEAVGRPDLAEKYCCHSGEDEYVEIPSPPLTAPFKEGRPNPRQILSLAREVKNWKQLGRALRLHDPQLDEIDEDIKGLFEKRHAMLRRWMEAKGSAATYRELARGLGIVGRRDLIRNFCCERKRCKLPYCLLSVSRTKRWSTIFRKCRQMDRLGW
ncbi:hypothetical protein OS493_032608 [Desmophyllum pertusum]|uniref:Death domain-containing protein n=1 Tax=Desmophyllum pertusum TaxID=174260 RepID=A0A9W9YJB1_9CNID|nr:hypothetical protein OS493_032608 [Desmophyllum pertusum]